AESGSASRWPSASSTPTRVTWSSRAPRAAALLFAFASPNSFTAAFPTRSGAHEVDGAVVDPGADSRRGRRSLVPLLRGKPRAEDPLRKRRARTRSDLRQGDGERDAVGARDGTRREPGVRPHRVHQGRLQLARQERAG